MSIKTYTNDLEQKPLVV